MITLFHKASAAPSVRIANLLKQASAHAAETATEDQASDHSHQTQHTNREPFEVEVTENAPTPDQLNSILEYVGPAKASQLVKGATSQLDALKKLKENPENFVRPVVVDWNQGKAVVGDNESEILKLVREAPSDFAKKPMP